MQQSGKRPWSLMVWDICLFMGGTDMVMDMDTDMVMDTDITCGKGHPITGMEDTVFIITTAMRIMTLISTISWPIFTLIPMATDHCTTTVIGGDRNHQSSSPMATDHC